MQYYYSEVENEMPVASKNKVLKKRRVRVSCLNNTDNYDKLSS